MHHIVRLEDFTIVTLRDGTETSGQFCMCEVKVNPQTIVAWQHRHLTFDQTVVGMEGLTRWTIGVEQAVIGPGDRVFIPRGTTHGFLNRQAYAARFLCIYTPAVISPKFFDALYEAGQSTGEERLQRVQAVLECFGTTLVRQG